MPAKYWSMRPMKAWTYLVLRIGGETQADESANAVAVIDNIFVMVDDSQEVRRKQILGESGAIAFKGAHQGFQIAHGLLQLGAVLPGEKLVQVPVNERIREELRAGNTPQASIFAGYEQAFATILDSNITTLIAGVALFMFGSGPVRGFAVVLCLGILTSMFSAVLVSRALVNLIYGRRARLAKVSIG